MKAGTHNRKYEYIPPEQRIGEKEQQRKEKSKTKLLKPTTALTNYSELANQANMKYPSKL